MARNTRTGRAQTAFDAPSGPSVSPDSTFTQRTIQPEQAPRAGFNILQQGLDRFFNAGATAMEQTQRALTAREAARIKIENEQQKAEGARIALQGGELTPEQMSDLDYVNAFSSTLGRKTGSELALDFKTHAIEMSPEEDAEAAREAWLAENFSNGMGGLGIGDDLFDAEVISTFYGATDQTVLNHAVERVKFTQQMSIETSAAAVTNGTADGTLRPEDIPVYISRLRGVLDDPKQAAPIVASWMLAGADTPEGISRVERMLSDPRSGDGTTPFSELFPGAFDTLQSDLQSRRMNRLTVDAQAAYEGVADEVQQAILTEDVNTLSDLLTRNDAVFDQHGGGNQHAKTETAILSAIDDIASKYAGVYAIDRMLDGSEPVDDTVVNKNMDLWLSTRGYTLRENPGEVAGVIARLDYQVPTQIEKTTSALLTNSHDPEGMVAAYRLYAALDAGAKSLGSVSADTLDGAAENVYMAMTRRVTILGEDPLTAAQFVADNVDAMSGSNTELDIKKITGKTNVTEARMTIATSVRDEVADLYGVDSDDVTWTAGLAEQITEEALLQYRLSYGTSAGGDIDGITDELAARIASGGQGFSVVPGRGSSLFLRPVNFASGLTPTPFSEAAFNPATGETENTIERYYADRQTLFDGLTDAGLLAPNVNSAEDLALAVAPHTASTGVYDVMNGAGSNVFFSPGMKVTVGGETIVLSDEPELMAGQIERHLLAPTSFRDPDFTATSEERLALTLDPEAHEAVRGRPEAIKDFTVSSPPDTRFTLIEVVEGVYKLGYAPGFSETSKTVEQLSQEN